MWTDKGEIKGPFYHYHDILTKYGCSDENKVKLQAMWNEPHRVYHSQEHLEEILSLIEKWKIGQPDIMNTMLVPGLPKRIAESEYEALILAAFFHDAMYDPKSQTNEEDSAVLYSNMCAFKYTHFELTRALVHGMILDTKDHTKKPSSDLSAKFLEFDLHGLLYGSLSRMISDENKIMREFGFVDFTLYKDTRGTKFLEKFAPHIKSINPQSNIDSYLDWYKNRIPKIAVYPGSFNPLHLGHLDVLKKAERIFDKVILAVGINPDKPGSKLMTIDLVEALRKKLPNNQVESFEGMLTEYINTKKYPITIIKGLRNPVDFDYEKHQLRFMEDMDDNISIAYIISDRKYEHLSSSAIRQIHAVNPELIKKYIP